MLCCAQWMCLCTLFIFIWLLVSPSIWLKEFTQNTAERWRLCRACIRVNVCASIYNLRIQKRAIKSNEENEISEVWVLTMCLHMDRVCGSRLFYISVRFDVSFLFESSVHICKTFTEKKQTFKTTEENGWTKQLSTVRASVCKWKNECLSFNAYLYALPLCTCIIC